MATKNGVDFSGWEFFDVYDNVGFPGMFVSPTRQDITINVCGIDRTVNALNWNHAVMMAYRVTVWASSEIELHENVRAFRSFLRSRSVSPSVLIFRTLRQVFA